MQSANCAPLCRRFSSFCRSGRTLVLSLISCFRSATVDVKSMSSNENSLPAHFTITDTLSPDSDISIIVAILNNSTIYYFDKISFLYGKRVNNKTSMENCTLHFSALHSNLASSCRCSTRSTKNSVARRVKQKVAKFQ